MRKETFLAELTAAIARLGWPRKHTRRIIQEVSDHWEELKHEARESGWDEAGVAAFARQRIGDPATLVHSYEQAMRTGAWAGRHPFFCFLVLPPVALVLWFLCWSAMTMGAGELYAKLLNLNVPGWTSYLAVLFGVKVILYSGVFTVPALFWWWARSSFCGLHWRWAACAMCALHGLLNHVSVRPHQLHWGYGIASVDWLTVVAPLFIAALAHACERRERIAALAALICASMLLAGCTSPKTPQQRAWIGGEFKAMTHPKENSRGLLITALRTNTPAARSGLREGDLIIAVGENPLRHVRAFQRVVDAAPPGSVLPLQVLREGSPLNLDIRTGRETFTFTRSIVVGLLMSREVDPWPNPDFSLVALGYKRQHKRLDLASPESQLRLSSQGHNQGGLRSSEGWEVWLPVLSFSSRKRILSQELAAVPVRVQQGDIDGRLFVAQELSD